MALRKKTKTDAENLFRFHTTGDKVFEIVNVSILFIILIVVVYPLIFMVSSSFSSTSAVAGGRVWLLPVEPTLLGYRTIFDFPPIWVAYRNTIFYTVVGTSINIFMTILAAYPLSRKDFYGRNFFMFLITFTMFFSGGMIPTYLLVHNLGMINTRWALIIPPAISAWNVIITRTYYQANISDEILDAAKIDGCSDFRFLISIVLPISGAITAVNVLFYAVFHWNSYFDALIYLNREDLLPLQIILRRILILNSVDGRLTGSVTALSERIGIAELIRYALIVVSSAPILMLYPLVQKFFVRGVMVGSIKG